MTSFFRPEQWERQSIDSLTGFRKIEFIDFSKICGKSRFGDTD